jgi:hypothetical protein
MAGGSRLQLFEGSSAALRRETAKDETAVACKKLRREIMGAPIFCAEHYGMNKAAWWESV